MKTRHLLLTALILAIYVGIAGAAEIQREYKGPITPGVTRGLLPDLVCSVAAYKDSALTQSIPDGGSGSFSDPSPKVWLVVTLQNIGNADIQKSFETRVQYKYKNKVVANPGFQITPPVTKVPDTFGRRSC